MYERERERKRGDELQTWIHENILSDLGMDVIKLTVAEPLHEQRYYACCPFSNSKK